MKCQLLFSIEMPALTQGPWLAGSEEESRGGAFCPLAGLRRFAE